MVKSKSASATRPRKFTESIVVAYRDGYAAAEWERRKPSRPPRDGREVWRREMKAIFDSILPGSGRLPASLLIAKYRRQRDQGAFVMGWVDAMSGRDAKPKAGDGVVPLP